MPRRRFFLFFGGGASLQTLNASIVLQSAMFAGKVGQQEEKSAMFAGKVGQLEEKKKDNQGHILS